MPSPAPERRVPLSWSLFADRMLRQMAPRMDALTLASKLGRTPMEVRARALALGVEFQGEVDVVDRAWGSGELSFLRQQYRRMTPAEIGRQLGRSAGAVRSKLQALGLRRAPAPKPAFLAPAAAPEPDPAYSVQGVELIETAERRMELNAVPASAPWLEPVPKPESEPGLEPEPEESAEPSGISALAEVLEPEEPEPAPAPKPESAPFRWWTADEDERLRQLVKEQTPLAELAELFGRGEEEVRRRILRVCAEPDPAVQAQSQRWGYGRRKPRAKPKPAGPIPEERLASMSKMDVLRALAGLA